MFVFTYASRFLQCCTVWRLDQLLLSSHIYLKNQLFTFIYYDHYHHFCGSRIVFHLDYILKLGLSFCLFFFGIWFWISYWFIAPWTTFYRILITSNGVVDMWNENIIKKSDEKQRNNAENDQSWNMDWCELLRVLNLHFNLTSY